MDRMIRCISADGSVMACAVDVSDMAFTAQKVHEATPVAAAALGRLLAAGSMMGGMLKQKEASLTAGRWRRPYRPGGCGGQQRR